MTGTSETAIYKQYIKSIEDALKGGTATEHTHRPSLKTLLESLEPRVVAINEPKRIACGAPDFTVTQDNLSIGYLECKDVGKSLDDVERSDQLKRYSRSLSNFILTDYLEFRWYVDGELRQKARLARVQSGGKLKTEQNAIDAVDGVLMNFFSHEPQDIRTPKELAERMARLTRIIYDIIISAFENEQASALLTDWRDAFAKVLMSDLNLPENTPVFADMFAQTLAFGLFTARVMDTSIDTFSRSEAQYLIPKSNPFLRDFFIQITGPQLDDEPFVSFVDDLVNLLMHTDMDAVLANFGRRTRQEDPIVHFYETFLAAYDPNLRESRGVYYTPEPVVSYMVRSVDYILRTRFACKQGLADSSKITIQNYDPSIKVKGKKQIRKTIESHKVLLLDPAAGTGTFPYAVIDHIREQFITQDNAGMWPGYVRNDLLPRLYGFELLMAPYAVAHFKLSLQLAGHDLPENMREQWDYHLADDERLRIYLTNTLEEAHEMTGLPLFTQWVADETVAANEVKQFLPVLVVMGNPPYSGHSANKGDWIDNLLKGKSPDGGKTSNYYEVDGQPLGERNTKWLQNDYVKFIRFAQWRIEQTGHGVLAFITDHSYLNSPTFRGMRQQLMETFSDIYLLNLHGNSTVKEVPPSGLTDENVFDIQQGVVIGIFVKYAQKDTETAVHYADLWGKREDKYSQLIEMDLSNTNWEILEPKSPFYFFVPKQFDFLEEYQNLWQITNIFPKKSMGIATARDKLTIRFSPKSVLQTIKDFSSLPVEEARAKFKLGKDARDWKVELAQADIVSSGGDQERITPISYRPFDVRFTYYTGKTRGFICMPRPEIMTNLNGQENLSICFVRRSREQLTSNYLVAKHIIDKTILSSADNAHVAPLYLYPTKDASKQASLIDISSWEPDEKNDGRIPNLDPDFVAELENKLDVTFASSNAGDLATIFNPRHVFYYIYSILHSPTYRTRYAEFLKVDFPRIPITSNADLFRTLCKLGERLALLHLLESFEVEELITSYPVPGENQVAKGYPKYTLHEDDQTGRVYINKTQYFEGVPLGVWEFYIGGYQVLQKWLKDRRGRQLSYDELAHYQKVVVALQQTIETMSLIDDAIQEWPIT